jgi:penicillin-binding protein-related factor A (putative recombinase)
MPRKIPRASSSSRANTSSKPATSSSHALRGRELENLILGISQRLAARQVARLFRWPIDKILQDSSSRCSNCGVGVTTKSLAYVDRGGCDFFGFTSLGAHIAIEAKQCKEDRKSLPLWKDSGDFGVKVHQMMHLREVAKAGGYGLIVWKLGEMVTIIDTLPLDTECTSFLTGDATWYPIGQLADRLEEMFTSS